MSERLLGIPRSIALVGLVGLVAALGLFRFGLGRWLPSYALSKSQISERAHAFAIKEGLDPKGALRVVQTRDIQDSGFEAFSDRFGVAETKRALEDGEIVLPMWQVVFRTDALFSDVGEDPHGLTLQLDANGDVVGATFHTNDDHAAAPSRADAGQLASSRLSSFGIDLNGFSERNAETAVGVHVATEGRDVNVDVGDDDEKNDGNGSDRSKARANSALQTQQKFVWERQDARHPGVRMTITAVVSSEGLISFGRGLKFDEDSINGATVGRIVEATIFGLFVTLLSVALLGVCFFRLVTRDFVRRGRAFVVCGVFLLGCLANGLLATGLTGSFAGRLFGSACGAIFLCILVWPAWLAGEADAFFAWGSECMESGVALFSGRWRSRHVASSVLEGYFWGWGMLGALAVAAVAVVGFLGPDAVRRKVELYPLDIHPTILFPVTILPYALAFSVVCLLFIPSWIHRFTRRAWIAIPLGGALVGLCATFVGILDVTFGVLPPSTSWALVFGVAACALMARRGWLTAATAVYVLSTFYFGFSALVAAAWSDGLMAAGGLTLAAVPAVAALAFGPRLSDLRVREAPPPRVSRLMELARREEELNIARRVQTALLPSKDPEVDGFDIAGSCVPANEVGGDYYDYFHFADGRFGVAVGDVSGKGVPAAFCMTLTKGFMEVAAEQSREPHIVLENANGYLRGNLTRGTFVTMAYAVIDVESRVVTCARAGHNPPLILRDGVPPEFVSPPGTALGAADGDRFSALIEPQSIPLRRGDTLVFYTDGVTEATNEAREQFGEERLIEALDRLGAGRTSRGLVDDLLGELEEFAGDSYRHDDITIVVVKAA